MRQRGKRFATATQEVFVRRGRSASALRRKPPLAVLRRVLIIYDTGWWGRQRRYDVPVTREVLRADAIQTFPARSGRRRRGGGGPPGNSESLTLAPA